MISPTDLLVRARELIVSPEKWIKGAYEVNGCYCMSGALRKVRTKRNDIYVDYSYFEAYDLLRTSTGAHGCIPEFNDDPETTHEDVMRVFDSAIAKSRQIS